MKKPILLVLLLFVTSSFLSACSCNGAEKVDTSNSIQYSVDIGTKIEKISQSKQKEITDYVKDCKTLYIIGYKDRIDSVDPDFQDPYIVFTDTFIYDFSSINEKNLDDISLETWERIKSLANTDTAKPLYYIELFGYCPFYSENQIPLTINGISVSQGFFIYDDKTVVQTRYLNLLTFYGYSELIEGTTIINCGNKYKETIPAADIKAFDKQPEKLLEK